MEELEKTKSVKSKRAMGIYQPPKARQRATYQGGTLTVGKCEERVSELMCITADVHESEKCGPCEYDCEAVPNTSSEVLRAKDTGRRQFGDNFGNQIPNRRPPMKNAGKNCSNKEEAVGVAHMDMEGESRTPRVFYSRTRNSEGQPKALHREDDRTQAVEHSRKIDNRIEQRSYNRGIDRLSRSGGSTAGSSFRDNCVNRNRHDSVYSNSEFRRKEGQHQRSFDEVEQRQFELRESRRHSGNQQQLSVNAPLQHASDLPRKGVQNVDPVGAMSSDHGRRCNHELSRSSSFKDLPEKPQGQRQQKRRARGVGKGNKVHQESSGQPGPSAGGTRRNNDGQQTAARREGRTGGEPIFEPKHSTVRPPSSRTNHPRASDVQRNKNEAATTSTSSAPVAPDVEKPKLDDQSFFNSNRLSPLDWSLEVENSEKESRAKEAEEVPPPDPSTPTHYTAPQSQAYAHGYHAIASTSWGMQYPPVAWDRPSESLSLPAAGSLVQAPGIINLPRPIANECLPQEVHRRDYRDLRKVVSNIQRTEAELHAACTQFGQRGSIDLHYLLQLRDSLQSLYKDALFQDHDKALQANLEINLWKSVFYEIVELLRSALDLPNAPASLQQALLKFIEETTVFYQDLITAHQEMYRFNLVDFVYVLDDALMKAVQQRPVPRQRVVKQSLISCQRFMTALGDLARYKELAQKTCNYGRSRSWYLKAAQISPKNGRPMNQLGLLAVYTRRRLDAVFYLTRSLAAINPCEMSKQPLLSTFAEIQKKFDYFENALSCELQQARRSYGSSQESDRFSSTRRMEIWIRSDGSYDCPSDKTSSSPEATVELILRQTKTDMLHKRFMTYFLQLSGMIINKLNMESFDTIAEKVLILLRELLSRTQSPLTPIELVQVSSITLYSVHHSYQNAKKTEDGTHSLQQQNALQLLFSIFGVYIEHLSSVLKLETLRSKSIDPQLHLVLPALRVLSNWMMFSRSCYADMVNVFDGIQSERFTVETWNLLADLRNNLVDPEWRTHRILTTEEKKNHDLTGEFVMPEDVLMQGFAEWFSTPSSVFFTAHEDKDLACEHHRLQTLCDLCDFLDGTDFPQLHYDTHLERFVASAVALSTAENLASELDAKLIISQQSDESIGVTAGRDFDLAEASSDVQLYHEQKRSEEVKQKLLDDIGKNYQVCIEVSPSQLVPDTNTFIDHLPLIKRIVKSSKYTLLVPSPVLLELEGLKKRKDSDWVPKMARETLDFLNNEHSSDVLNTKLQGVTTKGNIVPQLQFLSEHFTDNMTADDRILKCCESLADAQSTRRAPVNLKGEALKIYRNVVLLTDDRNLRIKAMSLRIPVKTVPDFILWAKL